jgi:hypothetical protein
MATVYGVNRTLANTADSINRIGKGKSGAAVYVESDSYECSTTAAATVIALGNTLPVGAVIQMIQFSFDDLGTGNTVDIGTLYNDDQFASAIDTATAAGASNTILVDGAQYVVGTAALDDQITLTVNSAAATGTVKLSVFYSL